MRTPALAVVNLSLRNDVEWPRTGCCNEVLPEWKNETPSSHFTIRSWPSIKTMTLTKQPSMEQLSGVSSFEWILRMRRGIYEVTTRLSLMPYKSTSTGSIERERFYYKKCPSSPSERRKLSRQRLIRKAISFGLQQPDSSTTFHLFHYKNQNFLEITRSILCMTRKAKTRIPCHPAAENNENIAVSSQLPN